MQDPKIDRHDKIEPASIQLYKAEGACPGARKVTVASYAEANKQLRAWAHHAPKSGGYDKCDFTIVFADGNSYQGRFDITYSGNETLQEHVVGFLTFYGGLEKHPHCGQERYRAFMSEQSEELVQSCRTILERYDFSVIAGHEADTDTNHGHGKE